MGQRGRVLGKHRVATSVEKHRQRPVRTTAATWQFTVTLGNQ